MKKKMCNLDYEYAARLYCRIFGKSDSGNDFNTRRILDAVNTLAEEGRLVIESRFKHLETYEEIAEKIGCKSTRVRFVETKTVEKLRKSSCIKDMSISGIVQERDSYKQRTIELEAVIRELKQQLCNLSNGALAYEYALTGDILERDIKDIGLSIRAYNCLSRDGIKTVRDINALNFRELREIRNLGHKSCEEVIDKMSELGLSDWVSKLNYYREDF